MPSGKGKSRIIATCTLMLLLLNETSKVHFLFDEQHRMEIDKENFGLWWEY